MKKYFIEIYSEITITKFPKHVYSFDKLILMKKNDSIKRIFQELK